MHSPRVVFTHPDFYIIDKPVGLAMHNGEANGIIPVLEDVLGEKGLHLCHRLDTVTSGCLLLARHKQAAAELGWLFSQRIISKFYIALLAKKPQRKQGTVSGDMINRRRGQHMLLKTQTNPAITQFFTSSIDAGLRGALVRPVTGKTHQIRVAMRSLGSPIVGDSLYGGNVADRTYLHAWGMVFPYQHKLIECFNPPREGEYFQQKKFFDWLATYTRPQDMAWPTLKNKSVGEPETK